MSTPSIRIAPRADVVEPRQQVDQRRLAGAAAADDRDHLPGAAPRTTRRAESAPALVVAEADVAELDAVRGTARAAARPAARCTSVCVSSISKIRSDAAIACCRLALTRLSFLAGPYIRNSGADERDELARASARRAAICWLPYQSSAGHAEAAEQLHQRRQARQRRRHLHVRAEQLMPARLNLLGLVRLGAERLDDAVAGERLGADVRQVLERFLAAPVVRRTRWPSRISG